MPVHVRSFIPSDHREILNIALFQLKPNEWSITYSLELTQYCPKHCGTGKAATAQDLADGTVIAEMNKIYATYLLHRTLDRRVGTLRLFEQLQNLLQALFGGLPNHTAPIGHHD